MLSREPIDTLKGSGKIAGGVAGAYFAGGAASKALGILGLGSTEGAFIGGVEDLNAAANSPSIKDNSHDGPTLMPVPR